MSTLRYVALALGVLAGFTACDVEDVDGIGGLEQAQWSERDADADAEGDTCSANANSTTVCKGDVICSFTDTHGNTSYQFMPDGGCPKGWTANPVDSVGEACGAANVMTADPVCLPGCSGPVTSTSQDSTCCTKTKSCYKTAVADVDEDGVEPIEPIE